jgi:Protein of unknown function (DUF2934)
MSKRTTRPESENPTPRRRAAKPAADATAAAPKPRARKKAAPPAEPSAVDDRQAPAASTPTHEEIATRAYYIALERGFSSDPAADWLAAERELASRHS